MPKHTITFDYNDGTGKKETREVAEGAEYGTLPTATRSGYTFNGWYTTGGGNASASDKMGSSDVTLLANWTQIKSHSISYYGLEGATHSNPTSFIEGASLITLSNPSSRTGYSFTGWLVPSGPYVTTIDPSTETDDIELYAMWQGNTYSISYTGLEGATNSNSTSFTVGTGIQPIYAPGERSGYTFDGWYLNGSPINGSLNTNELTSSITLEAKWHAITYTINVEIGDMTGATATRTTSSFTIVYGSGTKVRDLTPGATTGWGSGGYSDGITAGYDTDISTLTTEQGKTFRAIAIIQ